MISEQEKKFLIIVGNVLKEIRTKKNLSQENLANDANIPINQIGRIERAEINTSLITIHKILIALEISASDFFKKIK
ncbi:helix-turn-helix domain-containing protein [Polaribacter sp.]|uniref:helix-turn-helix domain-containing protein n=1 Tax=Polaribacter sp. TaxID=1920175 RepID=UPI004047CD38